MTANGLPSASSRGAGAALPFDPRSALSFFALPKPTSTGVLPLQRQSFNSQYPGYANTQATEIAFTTPVRNQFFRQWMAGLRLTTLFEEQSGTDELYRPVGTVSFTIGQNELVTGGHLQKFVAQFEAAYPLAISLGPRVEAIYLFGRANLQLGRSIQQDPLLLTPLSTAPTDLSNVLVIARPSERDIYTLGVGMDVIQFAKNLFK